MTKLKSLIDSIEADPKAYDFLTPVDHVALGLVNYLQIISTPMDVSTVKVKKCYIKSKEKTKNRKIHHSPASTRRY